MKLIDLGLPSGTLWADRNLGADAPEQYGNYFRFGEIFPYTQNSPEYIFQGITHDISSSIYDVAMTEYDINLCIPDNMQLWELFEYGCWSEETLNGIKGMQVVGPNKKEIFLPAAGYRDSDGSVKDLGLAGHYRSSILRNERLTVTFFFNEYLWDDGASNCNLGMSIRPIKFIRRNYYYDCYGRIRKL